MKFRALFKDNGLSLDRLRSLVEVDDAGNISAAAPSDRSRQSMLSRQIGELERFFEVPLKRTEGRIARLTEEGKQLAALAREHLQSLAEFQTDVREQPLPVSLAAGAALHQWLVLPRLPKLRAASGSVIWQLHTRKNAVMCQQLLDGSLDLGLLRSDLLDEYLTKRGPNEREPNDHPSIVGTQLGTIHYSVFVPDRVCPRTRDLPLREILSELPLATQGDDTTFQLRLEMAMATRNWRLNAQVFSESFAQIARLVEGGTLAGILPDLAADAFDPTKVWRAPLRSLAELRRNISLAWNPARHRRLPALESLRPVVERILRFQG